MASLIRSAAIRSQIDGREVIYHLPPPHRHHHILHRFFPDVSTDPADQGFLTDDNRWVDRYEAFIIAKKAGQLLTHHGNGPQLFTEDLW